MTDKNEAPERIYLKPQDAALFNHKYGHPDVPTVMVGDDYVIYTLFDAKDAHIAKLESEAIRKQNELDKLANEFTDIYYLKEEAEAKLKRAVALAPEILASLDATGCNVSLAVVYRTTLEELKEQTNE